MQNNITAETLLDIALNCTMNLNDKAEKYLIHNGLSPETIKKYDLGFGEFYGTKWITIPIYGIDKEVKYIKLFHFPDDPLDTQEKYDTFPKEYEPILFNEDTLFGKDECMIVEGELNAIVASQYLEMPVIGVSEGGKFEHRLAENLPRAGTIYLWLSNKTDEESLQDQAHFIGELIMQCPNGTIVELSPPDDSEATEYFMSGGTIHELFATAYYTYGDPPLSAENMDEMSLDDLANVLDITIKNDRQVKTILFLALLLMYTESDQINVCLLGQSSSGKTYTAQEVAKFFPEEDITEYAEVSPTAFKHMSPKIDTNTGKEYVDCERRGLMFTEMPHPGLLSNLRPILSHDRKEVEFLTTDRGKTGGNIAKSTIIRGFPTVIFCSAYTKLNEQELTRCLLLSPEVSDEKLEASIELTSERVADPETYKIKVEANKARKRLKQRVRFIKDLHINSVIIKDYRKVLARFKELNPRLAPRSQRDIAHLSSLIKAVAMLNAPQRMDSTGDIIANDSDIEAGFNLWKSICRTQTIGVPPATYDFYEKYILPAYEKSRKAKANVPLPHDDGVTYDEIAQYYYDCMSSFFSRDTLRKQIIPTLQMANAITLEQSATDGRKWIIKPQLMTL